MSKPEAYQPDFALPIPDSAVYAEMYKWASELFPICRSLTGDGVRQTLQYFQKIIPELKICEIPSGTKCFDWTVPDEWSIREAYLIGPDGSRVLDFHKNNLHVVGYSVPVDVELDLDELQQFLHSLPEQPDAIPYVTSYYRQRWGFCISDKQRRELKQGRYRAYIDSQLSPGSLTYGELLIPGSDSREILLSTYVCHPSMANDNLSGPVQAVALARWLIARKNPRYSYRIVFVPETIGAIAYVSRNLEVMRERTVAGFILTCCGDNRDYSYLASPYGNTIADRVAKNILHHHAGAYKTYKFIDCGSDERQFCSPGVDLPVVSIMRSKYNTYPEYHTSLDDLALISPEGLGGAYEVMRKVLTVLEYNYCFRLNTLCEPQLGRRGLYPTISSKPDNKNSFRKLTSITSFGAFADGKRDLIEISECLELSAIDCLPLAKSLYDADVISLG